MTRKKYTKEEKELANLKREQYQKNWYKNNPYKNRPVESRLLWAAKRRANTLNLEFNLELSDIVVPTHCPILKIPLVSTRPRGDSRKDIASIDRIDPTKGYTKDNIEVISWLANTMKSNASPELLLEFSNEMLKRYG